MPCIDMRSLAALAQPGCSKQVFGGLDSLPGKKNMSLGNLPEWNLADLYPSPDAPELNRDLTWLEAACRDFADCYEGKLAMLDAQEFLACIHRYEEISATAGRILSYASLRYAQNTTDAKRAKFMADCEDKITNFTTNLVFFSLELNRIEDEHLKSLLEQSTELRRYHSVFRRMRAMRPHQLSDELELYLHDASAAATGAWHKLFDETMAGMTFDVAGEADGLSLEQTLNFLSDTERSRREAAAHALARGFQEKIKLFARIHNTLAKEKEINDRWRKMPTPQFGRHLSNDVEPEVVEALRNAVVAAYPKLSHRYYRLKARWMGLDKLQFWDRNAPLPFDDPKVVSWSDAQKLILAAYHDFTPKMAETAQPFFDKGWIDAGVKPGKAPGAFSHPTVSTVHPYVMMNYLGKPRDVMTLAHELGHGVHQVLAAGQGELLASTPLTLAETASVFGEMLTFREMLNKAISQNERKVLLAGKVEDMINTVVRQIAFYDFECRLHAARAQGELTPDDINALWLDIQKESLGEVFEFAQGYETFWSYVPHFVHSPFYVYAYAFGDGLVNALYATYESGLPDFETKYLDMLRAGGSKHHKELLAPFGLDASDPAFWDKGLDIISGFIDELEAMEAE